MAVAEESLTIPETQAAGETDAAGPAAGGESAAATPLVIEPKPRWRAIDVDELWRYRELLYFLTWRDIKVRYKQTVLGAAWAIIQPVMTMIVFTVFFGKLGGMEQQTTVAYPIFVYAALLPWQFFSSSVTKSGQSLVTGANLISKVYFPRLIIPFSSVGGGLVDFAISFCVMMILMVAYGVAFTPAMLALPFCLAGTILAAVGVGTFLSALTVAYRDFRYVVPFLVQLWMFASPVAYTFEVVPYEWQLAYAVNPMAGIISSYRSALLNEPFQWGAIGVSVSVSIVLFFVGCYYFRSVERRFADIV